MHSLRTVYPLYSNHPAPTTTRLVLPRPADNQGPPAAEQCTGLHAGKYTIKKPKGSVGCLSRGGYSLRVVLGDWNTAFYVEVQKFVRTRLYHYMDQQSLMRGLPITKQPPLIIANVLDEVRQKYPVLSRYERDWPTRDMIATFLSNAAYPKRNTQ